MISRAVLLAPFLKHDAPTMRPNSGGWAHVLTGRIIGLVMLNAVSVRALNFLRVIRFNLPAEVLARPGGEGATPTYSFRLNTSFAPRSNYLKDIAALPQFLLLAGRDDEAFNAARYEEVMAPANPNGGYLLFDGVSHLAITDPAVSATAIIAFLKRQGATR